MVSPSASPGYFYPQVRKRTTSIVKRHLPITPTWLAILGAIVLGGIAVAFTILGLVLLVLAMNLIYLSMLAVLVVNMQRTGRRYWDVPFPAHPEPRTAQHRWLKRS